MAIKVNKPYNKSDFIRHMLLQTVGKNPDLFCYWASIMEARALITKDSSNPQTFNCHTDNVQDLNEIGIC